MQRDYTEQMYLNGNGIIEDVPQGFYGNVIVGKNFRFSHEDRPAWYVQAAWQHILFSSERFYLAYAIQQTGYLGGTGNSERTLFWSILQHFKPTNDQIYILRIESVVGSDWSPGRQLYLGTRTGLRGYDNYRFSGQRRLVYNLEYRLFRDERIWIFKPGAAFFFDGGTMCGESENLFSRRFYHSAGFGLRISNTKQQGIGILCVDFAYNFERKKFGEIIISSALPFSAFQGMGFSPPVSVGDAY
jgi:hypothetical protein